MLDEERQQLVVNNRGLAISWANKFYYSFGDDAYSEAYLGLVLAANSWKKNKGVKFSTFAWSAIRNHLLREQEKLKGLKGGKLGEWIRKAKREGLDVQQLREQGFKMDYSDRTVQAYIDDVPTLSLDKSFEGDDRGQDGFTIKDALPAAYGGTEDTVLNNEVRQTIHTALRQLPNDYRIVVEMRYGLHTNKPLILREIGKQLGITKQRAHQRWKHGLRQLEDNSLLQGVV